MDREQEEVVLRCTAHYIEALQAGHQPKISDYLARYPQYADAIANFIAYYQTVELPQAQPIESMENLDSTDSRNSAEEFADEFHIAIESAWQRVLMPETTPERGNRILEDMGKATPVPEPEKIEESGKKEKPEATGEQELYRRLAKTLHQPGRAVRTYLGPQHRQQVAEHPAIYATGNAGSAGDTTRSTQKTNLRELTGKSEKLSVKQKIAYLDCHSGISGNMFLGAMLDAGLAFDTLQHALTALPLAGFELHYEPFSDKGIRGTYADVVMSEQEQPVRHLADIVAIINTAQLSPFVQETALAIFQCLAEAEATVHGTSIEEVHFHEVGAVDAIVDIVGAAIALETSGIVQLYASPLPLSSGHVQTAHGLLPVPAPATLEILRRVNAPWRPCAVEGELVTPTGAAILATLARFETPAIAIERVGYGFGRKRFPWPNCLRLCIGQTCGTMVASATGDEADTDWVTVIEANIDNMSGELLGDLMERLLAAGALDVSYTPMQMKKNRPAVMLRMICSQETGNALAMLLLRETTTLGVRMQHMQRLKAQRSFQHIETPFGPLLVKIKRLGQRILSAAPEYEECQRIARERGIPLTEVYEVAQHIIENDIIEIEL